MSVSEQLAHVSQYSSDEGALVPLVQLPQVSQTTSDADEKELTQLFQVSQ